MSFANMPFNIALLPNDKHRLIGMLPVTSQDIYGADKEFHTQGLYSTAIFGELGTQQRQTKMSFIDVRATVLHPKIYLELTRLKNLYAGIMQGKAYATWDDKLKDFVKSNIIDGHTGYSFFMSHFNEIVHQKNESIIRELRIQLLDKAHDKCMYQYILVLPAGLRDIETNEEGRVVEDEINGLYRKLIRISNTITVYGHKENDPALDTARWSLQSAFNEIYAYIESILEGKKGFLLSKWAARNVHGGTRNVITAMDPAPLVLGGQEAVSVNDTMCGLHQYLKGTVDLSIYDIRKGPMEPVIQNLPALSYVVDSKTLKRKQITPSGAVNDNWGNENGLEKLINGFSKLDARHKPIIIDSQYAALIYRDDKTFKVFYDIDELPPHKSKQHVKPITWAEMYYISVYKDSKKCAGYVTRYPIASSGSIYPSKIYLKTTVKAESLIPLDDNWLPMEREENAIQMPVYGQPFYDSMAVHPSHTPGLGADYD